MLAKKQSMPDIGGQLSCLTNTVFGSILIDGES